ALEPADRDLITVGCPRRVVVHLVVRARRIERQPLFVRPIGIGRVDGGIDGVDDPRAVWGPVRRAQTERRIRDLLKTAAIGVHHVDLTRVWARHVAYEEDLRAVRRPRWMLV